MSNPKKETTEEKEKRFQESLKRGIVAEDKIFDYLVKTFDTIVDLRNQNRGKFGGPKLKGKLGTDILPDFAVYDTEKFLIDVKDKTKLYNYKGKKYFQVDDKFLQYLRCVERMGVDYLAIIFRYNGRMYFYKAHEYTERVWFDNEFGKGYSYLFEYDMNKVIV